MVWNAIKALFSGAEEAGAVFKEEWVELLERDVPLYGVLPEELRASLHGQIARFIESARTTRISTGCWKRASGR
jgi:Mlc titration factor MtfA (ptsG expression regulator)